MAVRVRLRRIGKNPKGKPHFRFSVFDETRSRDSRFIEELGFYNPVSKAMKIDMVRFDYWVSKGAQPTATVANLVKKIKKSAAKEA